MHATERSGWAFHFVLQSGPDSSVLGRTRKGHGPAQERKEDLPATWRSGRARRLLLEYGNLASKDGPASNGALDKLNAAIKIEDKLRHPDIEEDRKYLVDYLEELEGKD